MKTTRIARRIKRVRAKISGTAERPRLTVFRSNRQIAAQLIDDEKGVTLAAVSSLKETKGNPTEQAKIVGEKIAVVALEKKIKEAVFDRRDKQYHGRIKALAQAAREKGLKI